MIKENRHSIKGMAVAVFTLLCLAPAAWAQGAPSGEEVMNKVFSAARPKTMVETLSMTVRKGGQSLNRTLTSYSSGDGSKGQPVKTLIKFTAPADVKGLGFLSIKNVDGSSVNLLWLPTLGRVRRMGSSAADQDQAFFGSDFTNRDINGYDPSDFSYQVTATEGELMTVEATPKRPLGYERLVYQIDSSLWRYVKIQYWRAGKMAKEQKVEYVKLGDYYLPRSIVMTTASKSSTELVFSDYQLDQELSDSIFTESFLKQ